MAGKFIEVEVADDGVARLTLSDPDRRNALSYDLLEELVADYLALEADERVRCIVLASSHPTVFSAGGNLSKMSANVSPLDQFDNSEDFRRLLQAMVTARTPTICAASGHVLAGALGIALACDLIVASERATFGLPEINVGVFPFMVTALLYRNVPRKFATELLIGGERIDAESAHRLGIVNRVVPGEQLDEAVAALASSLAAKSPLLMRMGKEAIAGQMDLPVGAGLDYLHHRLVLALTTEDIREGTTAFFEKRDPVWKGR